jgi:hypothetical protein
VPKRQRNLTLKRLRAGAAVLKTASPDARHGAYWTYLDGKLAAASVCAHLERLGLLVTSDSLFAGESGQTYRYAPPPKPPRKAARRAPATRGESVRGNGEPVVASEAVAPLGIKSDRDQIVVPLP